MVTFSSAMNVEDSTSVPDKIRSLWPPEHPAGALSTDTASRSVGLGKVGQRNFSSTGGRAPGAFFYQTMKFYTRVPKEVAVGLRLAFHCCRMSNQRAADLSFRSLDLPTWPGRQKNYSGLAKVHSQQVMQDINIFCKFSKCAAMIPANGPAHNGWDSRGYSEQSPLDFL